MYIHFMVIGKTILSLIRMRPVILLWECTYRCNSRCEHCNVWRGITDKYKQELSTEGIKSIIDQSSELGVTYFIITGGEPLLREDLLEVMSHAKRKGMIIELLTNGFILKQFVKELKTMVDFISISLDYPIPAKHDEMRGVNGAFDKVIEGIIAAKQEGIIVNTHATLTDDSINYVEELANFVKDLGCTLSIGFVEPFLMEDRDLSRISKLHSKKIAAKTILELKKKYPNIITSNIYYKFNENGGWGYRGMWCKAPIRWINVRPNGCIAYPCHSYWGEGYLEIPVNNDLNKIWFSKEFKKARRIFKKCTACSFHCIVLTSAVFTLRTFFSSAWEFLTQHYKIITIKKCI